ncbi:MAG: nucleoside triphosphate pyrophosphohydrolase [Myxococcales bacterium]|nr:nucleoside triphosphate pyrophosphohydrolase [Myxococcales bacterium]
MAVDRLLSIMERLRDPERGCPWDIEQSFETIAPYTIEEAYEVEDAIRRGDWKDLCDELGDLLLQVVFHAQLAREASHFDFAAVVDAVCDKLVRRHPHVFSPESDAIARGAEDVHRTWEERKAQERAEKAQTRGVAVDLFDDVPRNLPALLRASKLQKRANRAAVGSSPDPRKALVEAASRFAGDPTEERLGEVLSLTVEVARGAALDAETALRAANDRFVRKHGRPA